MGDKNLLIAGIDPGTTTGYAILDLNGKIVELKSSKNLGLNILIDDVLKVGKVVCVGTDKAKIPNLVELFAAKIGAKIIYPKEDLKAYEKRKLSADFKTEDEHQHDALASALFAFRKIKGILERIDRHAEENEKQSIKDKIADLVLTKEISIREAIDIIEHSGKEETGIIKRVVEEKKLSQSDFMALYRTIKRHEKENFLLKGQNNNLKSHIGNLEKKYSSMSYKTCSSEIDKKMQKSLLFKEKSISFLEKELAYKGAKIRNLLDAIKKLNNFISRIDDALVLKKLDNLGSAEFSRKKIFLNIKKDDILLVNNPNIISNGVMNFLKNFVGIIIAKIPPSEKIRQEYDFAFLDYKKLRIEESGLFAIVPKEDLKAELKNKDMLKSIIADYKNKRKIEISQVSP